MSKSDIVWFCAPCREKVERNIVVDRMAELEIEMKNESSQEKVRDMIKEELGISTAKDGNRKNNNAEASVTEVVKELDERKNREKNIIIYGLEETNSEPREARHEHDQNKLLEVCATCYKLEI